MHYETVSNTNKDGSSTEKIFAVFGGPDPVGYIKQEVPKIESDYFNLKEIPGRGLGLIAKVDIPRGTTISSERAIMQVYPQRNLEGTEILIMNSYQNLTSQQKKQVRTMARTPSKVNLLFHALMTDHRLEDYTEEVRQAMRTTFFKEGSYAGAIMHAILLNNRFDGEALFPNIARINHDCLPNCRTVQPNPQTAQIIASRRISAGEEITLSYKEPGASSDSDQFHHFSDEYGFECQCSICRDPVQRRESIRRRNRIHRIMWDIVFLKTRLADRLFRPRCSHVIPWTLAGPLPVSIDVGCGIGDAKVYALLVELRLLYEKEGLREGAAGSMYQFGHELTRMMYLLRHDERALAWMKRWRAYCEDVGVVPHR